MPEIIKCPHCQKNLRVDTQASQQFACPYCGQAFSLPEASADISQDTPLTIPPQACNLAILALTMGIISIFFGIVGIPAIFCGIMALCKIKKSNGRLTGRKMAIWGIILPLVKLAFIIIFFGIILAIKHHHTPLNYDRKVNCVNRMKNLGLAMLLYANDNDDFLPTSLDVLKEQGYVIDDQFLYCPSDGRYSLLPQVQGEKIDMSQASLPVAFCQDTHENMRIVLFADGHVESLSQADFQKITE